MLSSEKSKEFTALFRPCVCLAISFCPGVLEFRELPIDLAVKIFSSAFPILTFKKSD